MPNDPAGNLIRQCAALPYRRRDGVLEVLLVTRRSHAEWIIPKGSIEPGHTEAQSAEVEAREEAGVVGRIAETCAGTFDYRKAGQVRTVAVYDLEVGRELARWPEQFQRDRRWLPVAEAAALVSGDDLAAILRDLPKRLQRSRAGEPPASPPESGGKRVTCEQPANKIFAIFPPETVPVVLARGPARGRVNGSSYRARF